MSEDFRSFFKIVLLFSKWTFIVTDVRFYLISEGRVMITIKEIAGALGVSTTTVSNVIHGKTREVSPQTVERVQKYLDEVHYVPNINARNLAQNRSKIIGVVLMREYYEDVNLFRDPFAMELIGSLERAISAAGYFMMLYISDSVSQVIQYISTWNADGLVLFATAEDAALKISRIYKKPVVFIDTYITKGSVRNLNQWYVNIGLDDEEAAYEAVQYLIGCGHKKIAFLTRNMLGEDHLRFRGYLRAMQDAGLQSGRDDLLFAYDAGTGEHHTYEELARRAQNYTAVFCCSDTSAIYLINALEESGVHVPDDVSVIGFDDNSAADLSRPALTTVHQDITEKGRLAVEFLLQMVDGNVPTRHTVLLPTHLVIRKSVRKISEK